MEIKDAVFGPLLPWIRDDAVTDIDYNGQTLWLTHCDGTRSMADPEWTGRYLTQTFVERFTQQIADLVSRQFNRVNPELEAETPTLRVTILHESAARTGRSISIRKTPPILRLDAARMLEEGYCDRKMLGFLINSVRAHQNLLFCGMPGAGKTESLKYFASWISPEERAITIEDTMEIHLSRLREQTDCIEIKVDELFPYQDAIKASLRLNPQWVLLSEVRSREARYLLESWSTGIRGMTTIHTDDVRNAPDRLLSMMENRQDADRMENEIYEAVDIGVLLCRRPDRDGRFRRRIDQICCYERENGQNRICMLVQDGQWVTEELPPGLLRRYAREGCPDPWKLPRDLLKEADPVSLCPEAVR